MHIIPNVIDNTRLLAPSKKEFVSAIRQEFRNGTDLLIEVVPEISKQLYNVNFIIGGDGPKKIIRYYEWSSALKDRVKLIGF